MSWVQPLFLIWIMVTGSLVALQGTINSQVGRLLASPIQATFLSFFVATTTLSLYLIISGQGFPALSQLRKLPPFYYVAGLCGLSVVGSAAFLVHRVGSASFVAYLIVGQLIGAMLLDHFGLLGLQQQAITVKRLAGALLLVGGMLLIRH